MQHWIFTGKLLLQNVCRCVLKGEMVSGTDDEREGISSAHHVFANEHVAKAICL